MSAPPDATQRPPSHARVRVRVPRRCGHDGCSKTAKAGGFCIAHGGGHKCLAEGCATTAVSRGLCITHGGGKRCRVDGCPKSAQAGGACWAHGGGAKCRHEGCVKRAQSGGVCAEHGGTRQRRRSASAAAPAQAGEDECSSVRPPESVTTPVGPQSETTGTEQPTERPPRAVPSWCASWPYSACGVRYCSVASCALFAKVGGCCLLHAHVTSSRQSESIRVDRR